jgi:hypothetical protein
MSLDGPAVGKPLLVPTPEARDIHLWTLSQPQIWHNASYDLCCALAWWGCTRDIIDALDANLIGDTWVIQRIAIIAGLAQWTDLSLDVLHAYHGLGVLPKDPVIRLSYGPLLDRPLAEYNAEQIAYAKDDATAVRKLYGRQHKWLVREGSGVTWDDVCALTRKCVWLAACRCWGLRTNGRKLDDLRLSVERHIGTLRTQAQVPALLDDEPDDTADAAIVRADSTGAKHRQQLLVAAAYLAPKPVPLPGRSVKERLAACVGLVPKSILTTPPRRTKDAPPRKNKWQPSIKTARNVFEESGDARLIAFAEYGAWASLESIMPKYVQGATEPIHTRWGIADSTRTTSGNPPIQNLGTDNGIRECFSPRPGNCFVSVDHTGLENATLAQFGIWYLRDRSFADFVNSGKDLHTLVGSKIFGCTYEEAAQLKKDKDPAFGLARDAAKPIDFGAPGGAGWRRLKISAKQLQGLDWSESDAKRYRQAWVDAVPVGAKMHTWVAQHEQADGRFTVPIPGTGIIRRNVTFCSACNNSFQSLGAVVEAYVGWVMFKERLLDPNSPLRHCAMVNYVHDEFIWEVPIGLVHEAAARLETIMHEAAKVQMPDVILRSSAEAMAFWSKQARRIVIDGKLRVWPLLCSACDIPHDTPHKPGATCKCGAAAFKSDSEAYGCAS